MKKPLTVFPRQLLSAALITVLTLSCKTEKDDLIEKDPPVAVAPQISLTPVITSGLSAPMQFVHAGDGSKRIFIVQKAGTIRVYDSAFNFLSVFGTVSNVSTNGERGLLSMAFHPNYATNGFVYVYYTNTAGNLELARYHVNSGTPNTFDAASKVIVLSIPHPNNSNHNGGELHFGSD